MTIVNSVVFREREQTWYHYLRGGRYWDGARHNFQWLCCIMSADARLLSLAAVMVVSLKRSVSPLKRKAAHNWGKMPLKASQTNNFADLCPLDNISRGNAKKLQIKTTEEQIGKIRHLYSTTACKKWENDNKWKEREKTWSWRAKKYFYYYFSCQQFLFPSQIW